MTPAFRFKYMRESLGFKQSEFAQLFDTSTVTIQNWEKGVPLFAGDQIQDMVKLGLNPLYPFGYGDVTLPHVSIEKVFKKISKIVKV